MSTSSPVHSSKFSLIGPADWNLPSHASGVEAARMPQKNNKKELRRKIVLRLPDLDHAKSSVLNSLSSPRSRRNYKFAMEQFITWYCSEPRLTMNRTMALRFRLHLKSLGLAAGTINQRLAAVRRLAYEAADSGLLSPELAAGIRRVKGVKQLGFRTGNWLNRDQARLLLEKSDGESLRSTPRRGNDLSPPRMRAPTSRTGVSEERRGPASAGTLGNRGPRRKRRPHPRRSDADLGEGRGR